MRFARLTDSELDALQKEFIHFLVANGIPADDWMQMKNEKPQQAESILDTFSDFIYESTFNSAQFLQIVQPQEIHCFQYLENKAIWVGIRIKPSSSLNLSDPEDLQVSIKDASHVQDLWMSEKMYEKPRAEEMFMMYQKGARIAQGDLFKQLSLTYVTYNESN